MTSFNRKNESSPTRRQKKRSEDFIRGSQSGKQNMPDDPSDNRSILNFIKGLDKGERRAFLAPGRFGGVKGLAIHRGRAPKRFKRKLGINVQDSIELFGNIILETFAGLDQETRTRRAKRVTKGLRKLANKEKRSPRIRPGQEDQAAQQLDIAGQPALAAGVRGGAFTDKNPNKPTAKARLNKHIQKRGVSGEHDTNLAKGLKRMQGESLDSYIIEALRCWKGYKRVKGKTPGTPGSCQKRNDEDITTKEKKDINRRSKGKVSAKHELLKKRIDRAIAARKDEARGKYASKRYFDNERKGKRSDRKTYRGHIKFQAKRDDAQAKGKIAPPGRRYEDEPETNSNR